MASWLAVAAIAGGASATPVEEQPNPADDQAEAFSEDSVLIATRKIGDGEDDAGAADASDALKPISSHSEEEPELADPKADAVAETPVAPIEAEAPAEAEAEAKPATKSDPPPRIAKRPTRAASDVANAYVYSSQPEVARFHGVAPGLTTRDELVAEWGEPSQADASADGEVLLYDLPPFTSVDVLVEDQVVALIKVELDSQQQPERLARRLRIEEFQPVQILDESGKEVVGLAYPEKGMLLLLAPTASEASAPAFVTHLVIQPLEAKAFALRADQAPFGEFAKKMADLQQAISIDPGNAYANWQLAKLHLLTGASNKAAKAAEAALDAEPTNDAYRLRWAECLAELGRYDDAVLEARKVLDSDLAPNVVRAAALHQMGLMASLGESSIAEKAIGFHTLAIETADKVAGSADRIERITAKRLLVAAHLDTAKEISRRKYARKAEIIGEWIGRASGLAEEMIESDEAGLELRLMVARDALAALANLKPTKDPGPWVKEAEEAASQLLADSRDPMFRSRVEWQLGEAYFHALRIDHSRKQPDVGLSHADQAIKRLGSGALTGESRPAAELLVGRLYFHIGALHAVHKQDHAEAVTWYEKAEPLLKSASPKSEFVVPRRQGEALVSMAVSYWDQGQRERALELTSDGAGLMEQAVAGGALEEKSLAVPYGNLATMHRRLGNRDESAKFAVLARDANADKEPSFTEAVTRAAEPGATELSDDEPRQATKPGPEGKPLGRSASKPRRQAGDGGSKTPRQRTASRPSSTPSAVAKASEQPTGPTSRRRYNVSRTRKPSLNVRR